MTVRNELFIFLLRLTLLCLVLALLVSLRVRTHEVRPKSDRNLRIAYLPTELAESRISPYGPGFEHELVRLFCARFSMKASWQPVDSPAKGWERLNRGEADVLIGAGTWLKPVETISHVESGPLYNVGAPLVLRSKKTAARKPSTLSCSEPVSIPAGSFLFDLQSEMASVSGCRPPLRPETVISLPPLFTALQQERQAAALVGAPLAKVWLPFFPEVRALFPDQDLTYGSRWYWSSFDTSKASRLRLFWKDMDDSSTLKELQDKYLGFIPEEIDYFELRHFSRTIRNKLPRYAETIRQEADSLGLDPLLLIAMIYQESHFNRDAESETGVRGLLQLTQATAEEMGIRDRLDPVASIRGGARYLKKLLEQIEPRGARYWDTIFLALASYNQGLGHTSDAMDLARSQGLDELSWSDVKTVYPLLAYKKYHLRTKFGYCRGYEAVDYVESIRYYYYLLHGFIALSRPETKYLSPVLLAESRSRP